MLERHKDTGDIAMQFMSELRQSGFTEEQATVLVKMTVRMVGEVTAPILEQFELLRADVRRVENKMDVKVSQTESNLRSEIKELRSTIQKNCGMNYVVMGFGFVGIIVAIILQ